MRPLLAIFFVALLALTGQPAAASVGFTVLQVPDGAAPPLEVGVWYPADAPSRPTTIGLLTQDVARDAPALGGGMPLEVISHGNGGFFAAVFFAVIAPSSQRSAPPANPARFTPRSVSPERPGR